MSGISLIDLPSAGHRPVIPNSILNASIGWPFRVSELPHSPGAGFGCALFFQLGGAIRNSRPLSAVTHSFGINSLYPVRLDEACMQSAYLLSQPVALKAGTEACRWFSIDYSFNPRTCRAKCNHELLCEVARGHALPFRRQPHGIHSLAPVILNVRKAGRQPCQ